MKIKSIAGIGFCLALIAGCGGTTSNNSGAPAGATIITIASSAMTKGTAAYGTNPLHLALNTTVAWYNSDSTTHTATSTAGSPSFNTGNLSPGTYSSTVTFTTTGTWNYQCLIHGAAMTGTIIVP